MRDTLIERGLRALVREMAGTAEGDEPINSMVKLKSLQPGDRIKVSGKSGVVQSVVSVGPPTIFWFEDGNPTRQWVDPSVKVVTRTS
jgi:hypothetical protein